MKAVFAPKAGQPTEPCNEGRGAVSIRGNSQGGCHNETLY